MTITYLTLGNFERRERREKEKGLHMPADSVMLKKSAQDSFMLSDFKILCSGKEHKDSRRFAE